MSNGSDAIMAVRNRIGRVGVWLPGMSRSATITEQFARVAAIDELGYGALWVGGGGSGKDELVHAAVLLAASDRIVIGTGIASIWTRDAHAAATGSKMLAATYPGRFILGLGVSHAPMVGARGHLYDKPYAALRDYLDGMDTAPTLGLAPAERPLRVLAALRPRTLELARDRADGAHPYFTSAEHTATARDILGPKPLLAPEVAVLLDPDPTTAREAARTYMALYLKLPNYLNSLRALGFGDDDFADGGSDRLVDAIVGWGDVDAIQARVRAHLDAGADHVAVQPIGAAGRAAPVEQLRELAPALRELAPAQAAGA